jgi:S1-C subfamily serine protease
MGDRTEQITVVGGIMTKQPLTDRFGTAVRITIGLFCLLCAVAAGAGQQAPSLGASSCQESLPKLYERVSPAVVLIRATSIDPYDAEHRMQRVTGSGVIITSSGLILTNSHVVFGRAVIAVTLDDGTTLPAELVGADPLFDIALIRIPTPKKGTLPSGELGDSDRVQVGDEVYAIGNPLGLSQTLTRGIVSAINRILPSAAWSLTEPLIQTDAAINPGNSGGPLIDRCGNIIGITTAIIPEAQSIGFAIPANLIKGVMPKLMADGRLIRPWVGVQGQFVPAVLKDLLRIPLAEGFLVEAVEPGSPAEKAGLRDGEFELTIAGEPILLGGDIITELNGTKLDDVDKLQQTLASLKIGTKVQLTVFRENRQVHVDVAIVERQFTPWDSQSRRTYSPAAGIPQKGKSSQPGYGTASRKRVLF